MKRGIRGAFVLIGAGLLLIVAWLLVGGAASALAAPAASALADPAVAATGTPAATPTILPTPTAVVFPKDTIAPIGPSMVGFVISATLTCGATVIAVIIAAFSLTALLRGGYGPFLRTLVYGPKTTNTQKGASAESEFALPGADRARRSGRRAPSRSRRGRRG